MALVLPLLLLLLAVAVDCGRAFRAYVIITNAAREGVRAASRFSDNPLLIEAAVVGEAPDSGVALDGSNISIDGLGGQPGDTIRVTVSYELATILGGILGVPSITLQSSVAMVVFGMDVPS
jgi:hypothetical protein